MNNRIRNDGNGVQQYRAEDFGAEKAEIRPAETSRTEEGAGLLKDAATALKSIASKALRGVTDPKEVIRIEIAHLRELKPKLDQKVALVGGQVTVKEEQIQALEKEIARQRQLAAAELSAKNDEGAKGYLLKANELSGDKRTAEEELVALRASYEGAVDLRKAELGAIEGKIKEAQTALGRAKTAEIDAEVAGALHEINNAVSSSGISQQVADLNAQSATNEALLKVALSDNPIVKEHKTMERAQQAQGDALLAAFKAEQGSK
ncbi:MAG: hypothetical protein IT384_31625 [Deltaproteobacteria bacterium]|nr:hypothetical protein [Deltaproteobacteria bacterium]